MVDFAKVNAIDIHTHAEEPCSDGRDDGYNEFQAGMAAYYRARSAFAAIFPVDAEHESDDRSGWSQKYSSETCIRYAISVLKKIILSRSDCPAIKCIDEVQPLILKEQAMRLL